MLSNVRKVLTWAPIRDSCDIALVGYSSSWGTTVAYHSEFFGTKHCLGPQKGPSCVFHTLDDPVDILEVLPDETLDAGVFVKCLVRAVGVLIICVRSLDGNVIDKGNCDVQDFGSQDVGDILVKNRDRVSPTHRQSDKTKRAER